MRLGVLFALAIALALAAPVALADETGTETVELAYRVPAGCPNEEAFVSAVNARTHRAKFVDRAAGARRFVIEVKRAGTGYKGRFAADRTSDRAAREVTSARCEDLVEALVLFTAIAIDPDALTAAPEPPPPPLPKSDPSPPPPPKSESPPRPASNARPPPRAREPSKPKEPEQPEWHLSIGSGAMAATGVAKSAIFSAYPVIDLASSGAGFSPSVRLGLAWADGPSQPMPPGGLTLRLRAAVLSGCAYRLRFGGPNAPGLRVCALLEAGVLEVRPYAIPRPTSPNRPWFAAGPLVRVEVPLLPKRMSLGFDAALAIPFEREHGYVTGGPTVALIQRMGLRFATTLVLQLF